MVARRSQLLMGIKLGGSCQCCGCFVQLDSDTAVGSIFLYDRPMPTANEWTAYFPNFINDIIFGADASGVGGYLVQVSSTATDAFGTSYDIVVTLTDRTEDSVVATKEFLTFSSGVG